MPANIGPLELIVVLVIALVILGPKRLPQAAKSVGKGFREFKDAISGSASDDRDAEQIDDEAAPVVSSEAGEHDEAADGDLVKPETRGR